MHDRRLRLVRRREPVNRESHDPAYDRGTDRGGRPSKPSTDSARSWWLRAPTAHADDYGEQLNQLAALLLQIGL